MGQRNTPKSHSTTQNRRKVQLELYPQVSPYSSGFLPVEDPHNIYWEQCGNPDGVPILFLHGGPGAGANAMCRRFFDPNHYRIIIFDQRGSGRSHPLGSLKNNTTDHLIRDIEMLRIHLGIKRWHLFGGSWGSTLALAYATRYPEHCISMVLRGIFLNEQKEIDWFLYGMQKIFPEAWEQFAGYLPEDERDNLLDNYYARLRDKDPEERVRAAIHWSLYESACASLYPNYETISTLEQKQNALALARIEAHYFINEVIAPENSLLHKIDTIRSIPAIIVQGRYDLICPIETANKLHQLWPEADYVVVPDAGHSALDPPLRSRLIEATNTFRTLS